jgi:hypothetical protein
MGNMINKIQEKLLDGAVRGSWSLNPNTGLIDVNGDFIYISPGGGRHPLRGLRFGEVSGSFILETYTGVLPDLDGFPQKVGKNFSCSRCGVESLVGGPKEVGGNYTFSFNEVRNFEGAPERVPGNFVGRFNHDLVSFEGLPEHIGGDLNLEDGNPWQRKIDRNNLSILANSKIGGDIKFDGEYRDFLNALFIREIKGIYRMDVLRVYLEDLA